MASVGRNPYLALGLGAILLAQRQFIEGIVFGRHVVDRFTARFIRPDDVMQKTGRFRAEAWAGLRFGLGFYLPAHDPDDEQDHRQGNDNSSFDPTTGLFVFNALVFADHVLVVSDLGEKVEVHGDLHDETDAVYSRI